MRVAKRVALNVLTTVWVATVWVMDVLINLSVVNTLRYIHAANCHIVQLKFTQDYVSIVS